MVTKEHIRRRVWFEHCGRIEGRLCGFSSINRAVVESDDPEHGGTWELDPKDVSPVLTETEARADEREKLAKKFEGLTGYSFTPSTVARLIREG